MSQINQYPSVDTFTSAEKANYLETAKLLSSGSKAQGATPVTANIPLTDITSNYYTKTEIDGMIPATLVSDVTLDGASVVNAQGVAELTSPTIPVTDVTLDGTSVVTAQGVAALTSPTIPVTDVTVDGTSVVTQQGVAEITMPTPRTYALFNGGYVAWESGGTAKFDLTSTTEFNTGLNTDSIAVNSTDDGFVVPAAGIYNVTISIYTNSDQQSSSIYTLRYGLKKINIDSADTELEWDFFTLDNVNPALQSRHIHAIVALQANDVVAPFIKNTDPNVTSWTASISLNYVSFEKLGPVPQNN